MTYRPIGICSALLAPSEPLGNACGLLLHPAVVTVGRLFVLQPVHTVVHSIQINALAVLVRPLEVGSFD